MKFVLVIVVCLSMCCPIALLAEDTHAPTATTATTSTTTTTTTSSAPKPTTVTVGQPAEKQHPDLQTAVNKPQLGRPLANSTLHRSAESSELAQPSAMTSGLLQVTLGLFVVLMVIAGAAWFARRFGHFNVAAKGNLRIIGGLQMGARERVVLMQVGEKQLLLGVAPGRIQTLHVLEEPIATEDAFPTQVQNPMQRFSTLLKRYQQ